MPEGHSIHRAALSQRPHLLGQRVRASSPQGRFEDAALLDRTRVTAIEARGKHLFYRFETPRGRARVLHVHLGLAGRFRWRKLPLVTTGQAVRLRLEIADRALDLSGPLICELVDEDVRAELLARLGPDPLVPQARPAKFFARLAATRIPIGAMLLDQSAIAGIGNVYRAEILWAARLDPRRPSHEVTAAEQAALWNLARSQLRDGVARGRISKSVYKRRSCSRCGTAIETAKLAGRPCYFCPSCQH